MSQLIQLGSVLGSRRAHIVSAALKQFNKENPHLLMGRKELRGQGGQGLMRLEVENPEKALIAGMSLTEFVKQSHVGIEYEYRNGLLLAGGWLNSYVNLGLNNNLDRESGAGGTAVGFIGVDVDNSAVVAGSTFLHGSATAANGSNTVSSGATAGGNTVTLSAGAVPPVGAGFTFQGGTAETLQVTVVAGQVITFSQNLATTHANASAVAWTGQKISASTNARVNQTTTYLSPVWTLTDFANGGSNQAPNVLKLGMLNTSTDAGTGLIDVIGGAGAGIYARAYGVNLVYAGSFNYQAGMAVTAVAV